MTAYRAVLALPGTVPLLGATLLTRLAGRMFLIVVVLYALGRFADPRLAGWVGFAALAPGTIAAPLAGALLDRLGAGRMILLDLAASALWVALLAAIEAAGDMAPGPLLALAALYALTTPLSAAGIRTVLPRLVPAHARDAANALDTFIHAIIDTAGPLAAGALYGFAGGTAAFALIAALYALAALAARRVLRRDVPGGGRGPLLAQAWLGVVHVFLSRTLRGLAACYGLMTLAWGILVVTVPVAVVASVGPGPKADSLTGAIWATAGIAGIAGALAAGRLGIMGHESRAIALGATATAIALFPLGTFGLGGLLACLMGVFFATGPIDVGVLTLRQRRTDPAILGRVLAVSMSLNTCGLPVGAALGGALAAASVPAALAAAALASLLAALAARLLLD